MTGDTGSTDGDDVPEGTLPDVQANPGRDSAGRVESGAPAPLADRPLSDRYPEHLLPIAGVDAFSGQDPAEDDSEATELRAHYEQFCGVREAMLIGYAYNTARAYWGDLDDLFLWCVHRRFDIFELSDAEFGQYKALLRRRKYSESTIRRRGTALRLFRRATAQEQDP